MRYTPFQTSIDIKIHPKPLLACQQIKAQFQLGTKLLEARRNPEAKVLKNSQLISSMKQFLIMDKVGFSKGPIKQIIVKYETKGSREWHNIDDFCSIFVQALKSSIKSPRDAAKVCVLALTAFAGGLKVGTASFQRRRFHSLLIEQQLRLNHVQWLVGRTPSSSPSWPSANPQGRSTSCSWIRQITFERLNSRRVGDWANICIEYENKLLISHAATENWKLEAQ